VNGTSGSFSSPNYPNAYGNNLYCEWYITTPGNYMYITITSLITEAYYDSLLILKTPSCTPASGTYYSGEYGQTSIYVNQNTALVAFYSDSSVGATGFALTWQSY
jgi:cubilin